jgi:hypothetical protein
MECIQIDLQLPGLVSCLNFHRYLVGLASNIALPFDHDDCFLVSRS